MNCDCFVIINIGDIGAEVRLWPPHDMFLYFSSFLHAQSHLHTHSMDNITRKGNVLCCVLMYKTFDIALYLLIAMASYLCLVMNFYLWLQHVQLVKEGSEFLDYFFLFTFFSLLARIVHCKNIKYKHIEDISRFQLHLLLFYSMIFIIVVPNYISYVFVYLVSHTNEGAIWPISLFHSMDFEIFYFMHMQLVCIKT